MNFTTGVVKVNWLRFFLSLFALSVVGVINQNQIRNFIICAHIDHGKSTLADRFLELTNTVPKEKMRPQYLDMMDLEREKGITIKMQPVRMTYTLHLKPYTLNLIDTPGHVDFSYEVSRSLAAAEGAILLVDASKGIQAQTIHNLELAMRQNLVIIPAVNKIDLFTPYRAEGSGAGPQARIEETVEELANLLEINKNEILKISAKYGTNVEPLLEVIIRKIPQPKGNPNQPLRAIIFDSRYHPYQGVIAHIKVVDGKISPADKIYLIQTKTEGKVKEVGYFQPELKMSNGLRAGEIGYLATGIKEPGKVRVGDTITKLKISEVKALPGYQEPKPMVFASLYPGKPDDFDLLKESLNKLKLNDASLIFEPERKEGLGRGFRCGFLGTLHAEIVVERLGREFNLDLVISPPSVVFKIIDKKDKEHLIYSPGDWLPQNGIKEIKEPWVKLEIITPLNCLGQVLEILNNLEGREIERKYLGSQRVILVGELPLRKIITGLYDKLKSTTQGFASMNYEILGELPADLVKLEILIAGQKEEVFSKIVEQKEAFKEGKEIISRLKEVLPSQLFALPLQAAVSGRIIARETIKAKRRDVIAPLYGGDYTRKRKLLEKQKSGKRELKEKGKIRIPPEVFLEIFKAG